MATICLQLMAADKIRLCGTRVAQVGLDLGLEVGQEGLVLPQGVGAQLSLPLEGAAEPLTRTEVYSSLIGPLLAASTRERER